MEEILGALGSGEPCALVTVTRTWGSSPRPVGSSMVVLADGTVVGNISGGCVDADAALVAEQVIRSGRAELLQYGVSDETAMTVGLACGGQIELVVSPGPAPDQVALVADHAARSVECALVTLVSPEDVRGRHLAVGRSEVAGGTGDTTLDEELVGQARAMAAGGRSGTCAARTAAGEEATAVVQATTPRPRMLVFGAVAYTAALATVGKLLGYHVTVVDARPVFATAERVPDADEVVVAWPDRFLSSTAVDARTVICSLGHDPKFEIPLLAIALRSPAGYVGALGSRRTHERRVEALRREGLGEHEIARLRAPIGLDLGARTPEETAISIAAEIISTRSGAGGGALASSSGPIHGSGTS